MTKERLRIIIGENIRNERMARNFSIDELAELIDLTSGFVGLIERGQRGTTPSTLFKLADVFGIPIDNFFYRTEDSYLSLSETSKDETNRKKITSLISDFSDIDLDFVVSVIQNLRTLNRLKLGEAAGYDDDFLEDE